MDFIQVNYKAFIVRMKFFDAFSTENRLMTAAVEVFHTIKMLRAELFCHLFFVFVFKVKRAVRKQIVFLHDLIKNVYIKGQSFRTFKMLNQLSTDRAPDSVVVV